MKLTWVNHASYVLEGYGVKMIADPWIEGRVFNRSWSHLAPSVFTYADFESITHIWFSHEHPDHFFPPNISKIPKEYRQQITVFFQETIDKRVIHFCQTMGFKSVVEVPAGKPYAINEHLTALVVKVKNDTDSWMYLQTPDKCILNLNDCVLDEADEKTLLELVPKVDVLMTQFSFANWIGNANQQALMKQAADDKKKEMARYIKLVNPKQVIPFASYVWFCAKSNFHFNTHANTIDQIYTYLQSLNVEPLVFYPGDEWDFESPVDASSAIARYMDHVGALRLEECTDFETISFDELRNVTEKARKRALDFNNRLKLYTYAPFSAYLTDTDEVVEFDYRSGLKKNSSVTRDQADIALHSQNLKVCFEQDYGFDTILIAGTFEKPEKGDFNRFMEYEWVAGLNNQGKRMKGFLGRIMDRLMKN